MSFALSAIYWPSQRLHFLIRVTRNLTGPRHKVRIKFDFLKDNKELAIFVLAKLVKKYKSTTTFFVCLVSRENGAEDRCLGIKSDGISDDASSFL